MTDGYFGNKRRLGLIAGILAAGLISASGLAGGQALSAAAQQKQDSNDPMPADLGCETGAEFCEDMIHSTVSTSGPATVKVIPDKFTVLVGVETNGTTAEEAASLNADLVAKIVAALKALGISEKDISTSSYSVYPVYSQISANVCRMIQAYPIPPECYVPQEITSYRASSSLSVTLDVKGGVDAGKVIDTVIEAGANNVQGAYFFVSNERQEEIRSGLIADAITNAKSRADKAASAVDMQITGVKSINLNDVYFPIFYKDFAAERAGASTSVLPGQQEVSQTVQVTFVMT
jgi:uncharacterized protein YggE